MGNEPALLMLFVGVCIVRTDRRGKTAAAIVGFCYCFPSLRLANCVAGVCQLQNQQKTYFCPTNHLCQLSGHGDIRNTNPQCMYEEDACAILTGDSTILGSVGLPR